MEGFVTAEHAIREAVELAKVVEALEGRLN